MKKLKTIPFCLIIITSIAYNNSYGEGAPAASPLFPEVQTCVDTGLVELKNSCIAANPGYTITNSDVFALTASEIAGRAIDTAKCEGKTTKISCNICYQKAKLPLKTRFDVKIFHGLLKQAIQIIDEKRKATCPLLGSRAGSQE